MSENEKTNESRSIYDGKKTRTNFDKQSLSLPVKRTWNAFRDQND